MATKSIIKKLISAISDKKHQDAVKGYVDLIAENFTDAVKDPLFYTLPFDLISKVIKKVDFNQQDDPVKLMRAIAEGTSRNYKKEAILLLNDFTNDKLPPLTIDGIIRIISGFKNCELLTKLGELQEEEQCLLVRDYDGEIEMLKTEIKKLNAELEARGGTITQQKNQTDRVPLKDAFTPVKTKPVDYVQNIFKAITDKKLTSVQYLLEVENISKEQTDMSGRTPFSVACQSGSLEIVQYLCEKQNVNKNAVDKSGRTGFHWACQGGNIEIVQYLCEKQNINKQAVDKEGITPFYLACVHGQIGVVQYLCEKQNVSIETIDNNGFTPFYAVCKKGELQVVKYLCEKQNIDKEAADNNGSTPFHAACIGGNLEVVKYLCEKQKINKKATDKDGKTPFNVASGAVLEYLKSMGVYR